MVKTSDHPTNKQSWIPQQSITTMPNYPPVFQPPQEAQQQQTQQQQQAPSFPAQMITYYIRSQEHPHGTTHQDWKPENIKLALPIIRRPKFPEVTQTSLRTLQPCIMFVAYSCKTQCRSMGICVHYQFVLGAKRCPDGLICDRCRVGRIPEVRLLQLTCLLSFLNRADRVL